MLVPLTITELPFDHPDAAALREAQQREIRARYGPDGAEPGTRPSAADVPVFLVAYADGVPVGCGGLRPLDATHGELKRMYVTPEHRGTGVAAAVLAALEQRGRDLGWTRLRLETGDRQPDAIRFYTRSGYRPIENFGPYAGVESSRCFEKLL